MNDLKVLYEDNHIIVVLKDANVLSQSDNTKDLDMLTMVKNYIKEKYNKPGNVYVGLVHRLDRPVGGIMVFAKTSKAAKRLSKAIKENEVTKKYLAIVKGLLNKKEGSLENYILKDEATHNSIITDKNNGKYSLLDYKIIDEKDNLSLVDITLHTGRHHQIRVQFSNINHPLYGDQRYGSMDKCQIALYAYKLEFIHPVTKENMEFIHYPNINGIWEVFVNSLKTRIDS